MAIVAGFSAVIFSKQPEDRAIVDNDTNCTYISSTKSKAEVCELRSNLSGMSDNLTTAPSRYARL